MNSFTHPISNAKELEFAIFCIENIAKQLNMPANIIYDELVKHDILNGYIVAEYPMLHTQSKEYIVAELLEVMQEREITL